jgi:hypothetical protein
MSTPAQTLQADRLRYPGLLPREIIVLRAWLKLHESEYDSFDFNVRLGAGFDPGPTFPENIRKMAILNTQKRVDALGMKGSEATLIEVKDRATASAIGQLVMYDALWRHAKPTDPAPKLLLVANRVADDVPIVLTRAGIALSLVEADFSMLAFQPTRSSK